MQIIAMNQQKERMKSGFICGDSFPADLADKCTQISLIISGLNAN